MGGKESKMTKKEMEKVFESMDKNGDGSLSIEEIESGLNKKYGGVVDEELAKFFYKAMDSDGNGEIDKEEFVRMFDIIDEMLRFKRKNQSKMTESKKQQEQKLIIRFSFRMLR